MCVAVQFVMGLERRCANKVGGSQAKSTLRDVITALFLFYCRRNLKRRKVTSKCGRLFLSFCCTDDGKLVHHSRFEPKDRYALLVPRTRHVWNQQDDYSKDPQGRPWVNRANNDRNQKVYK